MSRAACRIRSGGAEILATRVRKRISVKKGGPDAWLDVHRAAGVDDTVCDHP